MRIRQTSMAAKQSAYLRKVDNLLVFNLPQFLRNLRDQSVKSRCQIIQRLEKFKSEIVLTGNREILRLLRLRILLLPSPERRSSPYPSDLSVRLSKVSFKECFDPSAEVRPPNKRICGRSSAS